MLPKIEQPHYSATLPISKEKVSYRPYLMKEQKIILLSKDADDPDEMIQAISQVLMNCTDNGVVPAEMNSVDIAYLMTKIRSASEGAIVEKMMRCANQITVENEDGDPKSVVCGHHTQVEIDLESITLTHEFNPQSANVDIGNGIGVKLKIPSIDILALGLQDNPNIFDMLPTLIEYIYDEDGVYPLKDESKDEIDRFIENLKAEDIKNITDFFEQIPKLKVDIPFTCEKCGKEDLITVEDIQNFLE